MGTEGQAGSSAGIAGTGGAGSSAGTGSTNGSAVESTNYYVEQLRPDSTDDNVLCMPRRVDVDTNGRAPCTISAVTQSASCDCEAVGRGEIDIARRLTVVDQRARAFLDRFPESPHAARVRGFGASAP